MMLAEQSKIVPIGSDINLATGATQSFDSINMKGFHHATIIMYMGTLGGADATLTINSGTSDGALTSALTFNYAWGSATALWANAGTGPDVLAAWTSAASVVLTNGTFSNFMLVCEVPATAMDLANKEEWLTCLTTDAGGATGLVNAFAILHPRYKSNVSPTALA